MAILVLVIFSWLDSRKTPVISFMSSPDSQIAIDVRGAIGTPGIIYLAPEGRLIDVVNLSGGLAPNADRTLINLSTRVYDGQMIVFPTQVSTSINGENAPAGLVNINTASIDELKELPGIGDVLAGRIVDYRDENGPYISLDELTNVQGITPSSVEGLRPLVTVSSND